VIGQSDQEVGVEKNHKIQQPSFSSI